MFADGGVDVLFAEHRVEMLGIGEGGEDLAPDTERDHVEVRLLGGLGQSEGDGPYICGIGHVVIIAGGTFGFDSLCMGPVGVGSAYDSRIF